MQKTKQKMEKIKYSNNKYFVVSRNKKTKKQKKCHLLGTHGLNTTRNPTMGQDSGPREAQ